ATLVGSLAQLLVLLSMGLVGLTVFSAHFLELNRYFFPIVISMGVVLIGVMLFCFFNIDLLVPVVKRMPYPKCFRRVFKHLLVLKNYKKKELGKSLAFAFCRYLTYSLQYYFLLKFYGIDA